MPRMLQSAMMRCTTRRDMGAQEVQHLNLQVESVDHNTSYARASTQKDSVELQHGPGGRPEIRRDTLTAYGEGLDGQTWPPRTMLVNDVLRDMPFANFVMDFYVGRNGLITRCRGGAARNRAVTFRPIYLRILAATSTLTNAALLPQPLGQVSSLER